LQEKLKALAECLQNEIAMKLKVNVTIQSSPGGS